MPPEERSLLVAYRHREPDGALTLYPSQRPSQLPIIHRHAIIQVNLDLPRCHGAGIAYTDPFGKQWAATSQPLIVEAHGAAMWVDYTCNGGTASSPVYVIDGELHSRRQSCGRADVRHRLQRWRRHRPRHHRHAHAAGAGHGRGGFIRLVGAR